MDSRFYKLTYRLTDGGEPDGRSLSRWPSVILYFSLRYSSSIRPIFKIISFFCLKDMLSETYILSLRTDGQIKVEVSFKLQLQFDSLNLNVHFFLFERHDTRNYLLHYVHLCVQFSIRLQYICPFWMAIP